MNHYTLWHALIGGILIGLASLLATVLSGKFQVSPVSSVAFL